MMLGTRLCRAGALGSIAEPRAASHLLVWVCGAWHVGHGPSQGETPAEIEEHRLPIPCNIEAIAGRTDLAPLAGLCSLVTSSEIILARRRWSISGTSETISSALALEAPTVRRPLLR